MRYWIVLKILSFLLLILGAVILIPVPFSIYYNDGDLLSLILSSVICMLIGFAGIKLIPEKKTDIKIREGFAIVTFAWILFSAFGALPFVISGAIPSYTDAFFETMSGFTTTGASILTNVEAVPHGILFWRSLTHWFGGLGIIVLTVAILPLLQVGGMQLFKAEVPGPVVDKLSPRISVTAKILWGVYLFLTILQTVLLMAGGMNLFDSLCHSFGTMATGGFSTKNASVAAYSSFYIEFVIIIFMFVAGLNFSLIHKLFLFKFKEFFTNREFLFYLLIVLVSTIIIGYDIFTNIYGNILDSVRYSLFQVVSIMTTTGFATADYELWSQSSHLILFALMFIGGSAGSTAGGIKVIRLLILIKFIYNELIRLIHPQAVIIVKVGNYALDRQVLINITGFFVVYVLIAAFSTIFVSLFGIDMVTSLGSVAATLNNIGPGFGLVGPIDNYSHLPDPVKWYLSFLMMLGRLEIYTVIILMVPKYWKK